MELNAEQVSKLTKVIYRKLGLLFDDKKIYLLNRRVQQRINLLGLEDADEYLFQLRYCDARGDEMQALGNLVTTNDT
jgi:chemotaxis protein methyltransferase CheR